MSKLLTSQQIERLTTGLADRKLSPPLITQSENIAYLITEALVVRSGILQQITVGEIEFLHKTFQEFLASIAVRWHDDEVHLIKDFDLRRWNELVILTVTSTTRAKATKMLELLLTRGRHLDQDEGAYYLLLAASCLRETHGLSEALQRRIVGALKGIVPPADELVVSLLAGAGDLVLPLLGFKESFSPAEIKYVLDTFVRIDTIESRNAIIEYLVKAECTDNLITSALEAVEYVSNDEFSKAVVEKLIGRNNRNFSIGHRTEPPGFERLDQVLDSLKSFCPRFRSSFLME